MPIDIRMKDGITNSAKTIDYSHAEIHGGTSYNRTYYNTAVASAGVVSFSFTAVPLAGKWMHFSFRVGSSGLAIVELLEGPTITLDSGSIVVALNANRNYPDASEIESIETVPTVGSLSLNATITAPGTVIWNSAIGSATGSLRGGETRDEIERVLKENTVYALRITSSVANNIINMRSSWYEHNNVSLGG